MTVLLLVLVSYLSTILLSGVFVTLGVDKNSIDTLEIFCITLQILMIASVIRRIKYGRR